jgi:rod shape-determining protein MreB
VRSKSLKIAGDRLNTDIISYIRGEFKILIGEKTAENIKIAIGSVLPGIAPMEASIRGRDLITGLPREVIITDSDIREAIAQSIDNLVEGVKEVLETTPPEIVADIMHRGAYLVGGGAMIRGLDQLLNESSKVPIHVADDPLTAVARGAGIILEDLQNYREVLIQNEDELPPTK